MNKKEKVDVIYENMAIKNRTFGCLYLIEEDDLGIKDNYIGRETEGECNDFTGSDVYYKEAEDGYRIKKKLKKIIGHPVMIGTVIERYSFAKGSISPEIVLKLVDKWGSCDLAIDVQSEECIDFVYSLIHQA